MTAALRTPDSVPNPDRPAGEPDETLPFEHVVVIVMENITGLADLSDALAAYKNPDVPNFSGLVRSWIVERARRDLAVGSDSPSESDPFAGYSAGRCPTSRRRPTWWS